MKVAIFKNTKTPFTFHYKEEDSIIRVCDAKFKCKLRASPLLEDYTLTECLAVGLLVGKELLNPLSIKPLFNSDKEKMHFMENINVYADLMILLWCGLYSDLPLSPNYVSFGVHSYKNGEFKAINSVFTKNDNRIINHWLFKEFKKVK